MQFYIIKVFLLIWLLTEDLNTSTLHTHSQHEKLLAQIDSCDKQVELRSGVEISSWDDFHHSLTRNMGCCDILWPMTLHTKKARLWKNYILSVGGYALSNWPKKYIKSNVKCCRWIDFQASNMNSRDSKVSQHKQTHDQRSKKHTKSNCVLFLPEQLLFLFSWKKGQNKTFYFVEDIRWKCSETDIAVYLRT